VRRGQALRALEVVEQADQVGRGDDVDPARPFRLEPWLAGQISPSRAARVQRRQQHAGRADHPPVERELADRDVIGDLLAIDHAHCREQRQRDRQVVVAAFLGQIGGREVDRDPLGREREAERRQRRPDPLAAFADRLVGKADEEEAGTPGPTWHCTSTPRASSPR
jgi:hypothetical protein